MLADYFDFVSMILKHPVTGRNPRWSSGMSQKKQYSHSFSALSSQLRQFMQTLSIPLYGTGLDDNHVTLAAGSVDTHYTIREVEGIDNHAEVLTSPHPYYAANDSASQWIWEKANGLPAGTGDSPLIRTFVTTFDLTGYDPSSAVIYGTWGTDNQGVDIRINGVSTGISLPGVIVNNFSDLHAFTISGGFKKGINTLEFVIEDNGSLSAFRTALTCDADARPDRIPELLTMLLFAAGVAGLVFFRKKTTKPLTERET